MSPAAEQLQRILYLLPMAHRPGGASLDELARALGVSVNTVVADLNAITDREYYHPGGSTDSMCIALDGDRVTLAPRADFDRPVRLTQREALAVQLGLHVLAAECDVERSERLLDLAGRIAAELVAPEVETVQAMRVLESRGPEVEYDVAEEREIMLGLGDDVLRGILSDAIAAGVRVTLRYLKAGAPTPELRHVAPQQIAYADGLWYLLAWDADRRDPRIFRLDRILAAQLDDATPPAEAQERAWIDRVAERGAPYYAEAEQAVRVRYSPVVARWVAERAGTTLECDGTAVLTHSVADVRWIVRHVLQFAGEAWVEEPASMRELIAQEALRLSA